MLVDEANKNLFTEDLFENEHGMNKFNIQKLLHDQNAGKQVYICTLEVRFQ